MNAYTPGPWATEFSVNSAAHETTIITPDYQWRIADAYFPPHHDGMACEWETACANARLMAQAPAMADELRALVAILEGSPGPWQARVVAGEQNQWVATLDRAYAILSNIEGK